MRGIFVYPGLLYPGERIYLAYEQFENVNVSEKHEK